MNIINILILFMNIFVVWNKFLKVPLITILSARISSWLQMKGFGAFYFDIRHTFGLNLRHAS